MRAQRDFENDLKAKGAEILSGLKADERLFVLVSRPYNGCDEGVNLQLCKKLASLGVKVMPADMLDFSTAELSDQSLHE